MNKSSIKIEAKIASDIKNVWDGWNSPQAIVEWNFASEDWCCPSAENDLRVGGKLKSRMEAKDGSFGFDMESIYDEIVIHEKISSTMTDGRKVSTSFETIGNEVKVTTIFEAEGTNSEELQKNGWQTILNNFKKYIESSH